MFVSSHVISILQPMGIWPKLHQFQIQTLMQPHPYVLWVWLWACHMFVTRCTPRALVQIYCRKFFRPDVARSESRKWRAVKWSISSIKSMSYDYNYVHVERTVHHLRNACIRQANTSSTKPGGHVFIKVNDLSRAISLSICAIVMRYICVLWRDAHCTLHLQPRALQIYCSCWKIFRRDVARSEIGELSRNGYRPTSDMRDVRR